MQKRGSKATRPNVLKTLLHSQTLGGNKTFVSGRTAVEYQKRKAKWDAASVSFFSLRRQGESGGGGGRRGVERNAMASRDT